MVSIYNKWTFLSFCVNSNTVFGSLSRLTACKLRTVCLTADVTVDPMSNCCELGDLQSGTAYEVQVSGFTRAGAGVRSSSYIFKTNDQGQMKQQDVCNMWEETVSLHLPTFSFWRILWWRPERHHHSLRYPGHCVDIWTCDNKEVQFLSRSHVKLVVQNVFFSNRLYIRLSRTKVLVWPSIPNPGNSNAMQKIGRTFELVSLHSLLLS